MKSLSRSEFGEIFSDPAKDLAKITRYFLYVYPGVRSETGSTRKHLFILQNSCIDNKIVEAIIS